MHITNKTDKERHKNLLSAVLFYLIVILNPFHNISCLDLQGHNDNLLWHCNKKYYDLITLAQRSRQILALYMDSISFIELDKMYFLITFSYVYLIFRLIVYKLCNDAYDFQRSSCLINDSYLCRMNSACGRRKRYDVG